MTGENQNQGGEIWVTRIIDHNNRFLPDSLLFRTVAILGAIPIGLTLIFFSHVWENSNEPFIISQCLVVLITVLGAALIRNYDKELFPSFIEEVSSIVVNEAELFEVANRHKRFFVEKYWLASATWTILIVAAVLANIEYFQAFGITSYQNVYFVIYLLFVAWFGIITGIGLHMVVTTIRCIREVGDLELEIDPLHPDQLGGLSNIGTFAIRTTMMNSIGALALPLAFTLAGSGGYESVIYAVVVIYMGAILFSFLYPTIYVNRRAEDIREAELEERRERIHEIRGNAVEQAETGDNEQISIEKQLRIQTLKEEFNEYQSVRLYPFTISIVTQLASSVLLPIIFMLLETYVISA